MVGQRVIRRIEFDDIEKIARVWVTVGVVGEGENEKEKESSNGDVDGTGRSDGIRSFFQRGILRRRSPKGRGVPDHFVKVLSLYQLEKSVLQAEMERDRDCDHNTSLNLNLNDDDVPLSLTVPVDTSPSSPSPPLSPFNHLEIISTNTFSWERVLRRVIASTFFLGILIFLSRRARTSISMGSQSAAGEISEFTKMLVDSELGPRATVTFDDVAGMRECKAEIQEFVDFFENFEMYQSLGARVPRGAVFFGPPGGGKTLLAKALAGEAGVPFYSVSGSDFVEMYVGVGAARVRDLFKQARSQDAAIIFIDEIDAIGRPRGLNAMYGGGSDERQNTLNQLLLELDGFTENDNVLVFGSTNVDREGLDEALLRPGRFDREVYVHKPDRDDRVEIFELYLNKLKLDADIWMSEAEDGDGHPNADAMETFAAMTVGLTGADIETIANEAGIHAVRDDADAVSRKHVESAIERVVDGIEKTSLPLHMSEREIIAYREAAHGIVAESLPNCDEIMKLSILQRGSRIGYSQSKPSEHVLYTMQYIKDRMCSLIAGRVAEEFVFGTLTTGVTEDLQQLTTLAYRAVSTFGWDDDVGPVSHHVPWEERMTVRKSYSEQTARKIDERARELIDEAHSRASFILQENEKALHRTADLLLAQEVVTGDELRELLK